MKYFKKMKPDGARVEISYNEALKTLLSTYRDNDMTRDMLTIANNIDCRYSWIFVEDDESGKIPLVLMAGLWNFTPYGIEYDDDGNRL